MNMKKRLLSLCLALLLTAGSPLSALAEEWYLENGNITISADETGQTVQQGGNAAVKDDAPVITASNPGAPSDSTITVNTSGDATAQFTIKDVDIQSSGSAIEVGNSNAVINLEGSNHLQSDTAAAVHVSGGNLTIQGDGSLHAQGGASDYDDYEMGAAAIGSNNYEEMSGSITITGNAQIEAASADVENSGAGIGSGSYADLSGSITIQGSADVTAAGGNEGAGIGTGDRGEVYGSITIQGSANVTAAGGYEAAGIGTGSDGHFEGTITIQGDANVKATGGWEGASGIGTGDDGDFVGTVIIGGNAQVTAVGNDEGCGIGSSDDSVMTGTIIIRENAQVKAYGGDWGAAIGAEDEDEMTGVIAIIGNATVITGVADDEGNILENETGIIGGGQDNYHGSDQGGHYILGPDVTINGVKGSDVENLKDFVNLRLNESGEPENLTHLSVTEENGVLTAQATGEGTLEKVLYNGSETVPTEPGEYDVTCVLKLGEKSVAISTGISSVPKPEPAPAFRVVNDQGRNIPYETEKKNGVLTITADRDFAILTGSLHGLETLKAQGIKEIVFIAGGASSHFTIADLSAQGARPEKYRLTHDGASVTFTLGEDARDVSAILKTI